MARIHSGKTANLVAENWATTSIRQESVLAIGRELRVRRSNVRVSFRPRRLAERIIAGFAKYPFAAQWMENEAGKYLVEQK